MFGAASVQYFIAPSNNRLVHEFPRVSQFIVERACVACAWALCARGYTTHTRVHIRKTRKRRPHSKQVSAVALVVVVVCVRVCVLHASEVRYPTNGNNKHKHVKLFARVKRLGVSSRRSSPAVVAVSHQKTGRNKMNEKNKACAASIKFVCNEHEMFTSSLISSSAAAYVNDVTSAASPSSPLHSRSDGRTYEHILNHKQ